MDEKLRALWVSVVVSLINSEWKRLGLCDWDESNQPVGKVIIYEQDKSFYEGEFSKGYPNGEGVIEYIHSDCRYEGQVVNGSAEGKGTYLNRKGKFKSSWMQWSELGLAQKIG